MFSDISNFKIPNRQDLTLIMSKLWIWLYTSMFKYTFFMTNSYECFHHIMSNILSLYIIPGFMRHVQKMKWIYSCGIFIEKTIHSYFFPRKKSQGHSTLGCYLPILTTQIPKQIYTFKPKLLTCITSEWDHLHLVFIMHTLTSKERETKKGEIGKGG